jgi:hypothetical protein
MSFSFLGSNARRHCRAAVPWIGTAAFPAIFLAIHAEQWRADFSSDPFVVPTPKWSVLGAAELFEWNPSAQQLDITWDSSRPNTFCTWPLPRSLRSHDAFSFSWDLRLNDAGPRDTSTRSNVLQISVVLARRARLPDGYPQRTSAGRALDLLDFSFFPLADYGPFGASAYIAPVAFGESSIGYSFGNSFNLADGQSHRVECTWDPVARALRTMVEGAGSIADTSPALVATDDFELDTFAIVVWNEGPTPRDSLLAHGSIRSVVITAPEPPVGSLTFRSNSRSIGFQSQTGYRYQLEASGDLSEWASTGPDAAGTGGPMEFSDLRKALFLHQFYRVRATRTP